MSKHQDYTNRFLHDLPFFSGLPEASVTTFRKASEIKEYAKGKHIFRQGDKADRFFIVLQGRVKRYLGTTDGEEVIVALFTRGDIFGEAAVFDNAAYSFSMEAAEDTLLIEIPAQILKDQAKANPDVISRVMDFMSREMYKLQIENEHKVLMDAPQRVGCLLLQLSSSLDGQGGSFSFPYDKALAAQCLGMRPETFSRALAQLKSTGVTTKGPKVTIDSFSTLIDHCCGHCTAHLRECRGSWDKPV